MIPKSSNEVLIYSRIATNLLAKLGEVEEDTLTGSDSTAQKLELILEAFQHVDSIAEDRYKKLHETTVETSGAVN